MDCQSDDENAAQEDWTKMVDAKLQCWVGKQQEKEYFSVMHLGGDKVLWHRPEDYEHACGIEVDALIKEAWYRKTGKRPMQWVVSDDEA